jgi:hypothetical protein
VKKSRVGNFEKHLERRTPMWALIGVFTLGFVVGSIVTTIVFRRKAVGALRVDHSDPSEPPYLFLELSSDLGSVIRKRHVTLNVDVKNYISHK